MRIQAHGIVGDVSLKGDIHPIAVQIVGELGGLDVLVNNASDLGPTPLHLLGDTDCEDLERALATNLLGPFRLTKAVLGALAASAREGRGAVVLNVSSDAAVNPYPRWGAYGASKAALRHLERDLGRRAAPDGVRFLSIDPGDMDTPLHAAAVPDADPRALKRPEVAARRAGRRHRRRTPRIGRNRLMIPADRPVQHPLRAKLLVLDTRGAITHAPRAAFVEFLRPGDLLIANDAATLPASLRGEHVSSGGPVEVRLAGRRSLAPDNVRRFSAVVFGAGDYRTRTEDRPPPPPLKPGDRLALGPLSATVERLLGHPRLVALRFDGPPDAIWAGLRATDCPSSTPMSPPRWPSGTCGRLSPARLSPSSRRRPASRSIGAPSPPCATAVSPLAPSPMPPASRPPATPIWTSGCRSMSPTAFRRLPPLRSAGCRRRGPSRRGRHHRRARPRTCRKRRRQGAGWRRAGHAAHRRSDPLARLRRDPHRHPRARHQSL